jgi:hypothetical protein
MGLESSEMISNESESELAFSAREEEAAACEVVQKDETIPDGQRQRIETRLESVGTQ